jgi:hypothetical protein
MGIVQFRECYGLAFANEQTLNYGMNALNYEINLTRTGQRILKNVGVVLVNKTESSDSGYATKD